MPTLALLGDRSADIILDVGYTAEVQLVLTEVMYISDMTVGDPRAVTVLADLLGMASA